MNRREFVSSAIGAAAAAGLEGAARAETANPPNILIFMPDQQNGATVLPGSPVIKPNLDKFLKESVTFTKAHCPAPHCCPSRASFMSGWYPSEHGVYNNVTTETAIHPNPVAGTPFWGNALKKAGYQMGYAGKLHVGRDVTPETCGFENLSHLEQDNLPQNQAAKLKLYKRAQQQDYDPAHRKPGEIVRPGWSNVQLYATDADDGPNSYDNLADTKIVRAGIQGMQRMSTNGKPWCVMISNSGGHDVYNVPKKFYDQYEGRETELPRNYRDTLADKPRVYQRQRYEYWSQLSDAEAKDCLRHYYAKLTMQDSLFGEILASLEATGEADNTIVLYVSDHGDYGAAHGHWMKGVASFQEAYHIPTVIRWPKGVKSPGRQVDAFVDQVDFASTVLEACGITPEKKLSGSSLMPWLRDEKPADWRTATCTQMNGVELYYTQRIVMTKDWKYVYNGFDFDELYDLKSDPLEMRNLAFPDEAAARQRILSGKGLTAGGQVPWPTLPNDLDAKRKELLTTMWTFAAEHHDMIFNPYGTVALSPYGMGLANGLDDLM